MASSPAPDVGGGLPAGAASEDVSALEFSHAPADRVLDALIRQTVGAGGRLPSERELAARSGLTRAAVRRVLAHMEFTGRVSRQVGRGTFLVDADAPIWTVETSPAEVMTVRLLLEPQVAALATTTATASDLEHIRYCLAQTISAGPVDEYESWDAALHTAIGAATHNSMLEQMLAMIDAARQDPQWSALKRRKLNAEQRAECLVQHTRIVDALVERDPIAAERATRSHLIAVRNLLLDISSPDS